MKRESCREGVALNQQAVSGDVDVDLSTGGYTIVLCSATGDMHANDLKASLMRISEVIFVTCPL